MANGGEHGTFLGTFGAMFLDMVIFLKLMTVSNGMLTFARSGVPKMLPKIDKHWCQKTILSFDKFFHQKMLPQAPQRASKMNQKSIKIDALAHLGSRGPPRPIFDRFLIDFGPFLDRFLDVFGPFLGCIFASSFHIDFGQVFALISYQKLRWSIMPKP